MPRATRLGHELGADTHQTARRDAPLEADPARAVVDHVGHGALARGEQRGDVADELLGHVDGDVFDRLVQLAVDDPRDHLGLADGEFESLATHGLDQHGQLQLAATLDLPGVGSFGVEDAKRDVADEFAVESVLHHARGEQLAFGAGQRVRC